MFKIDLCYNKNLVDDKKYFTTTIESLKNTYTDNMSVNENSNIDFQVIFNNKIIYTLDDNFDSDGKISNNALDKACRSIKNSIMLNKSKDISRVDDIGIDEY